MHYECDDNNFLSSSVYDEPAIVAVRKLHIFIGT